jgi:PAS domain S-box-containing protein
MSTEKKPAAQEKVNRILKNDGSMAGALSLPVNSIAPESNEVRIPPSLLNLITRSADFVYVVDADSRFIAVNYAVCRSLGYSQQELIGKNVSDIDIIYDPVTWQKTFKKLRKAGSMRLETMQRNREGEVFPVEMTINYLLYNGKEYCVSIGRDVTDRKQIEDALKESEEKYRKLIESAGAGMVIIDLSGHVTYVNKTFCRMTGCEQAELIGRHFIDAICEDDRQAMLNTFSSGLKGNSSGPTLEFRLRHKDGSIVWCSSNPTRIFNDDRLTGFNSIVQDITSRKNLEEALRESERKYRAVVEDQLEMICRFVPDGSITFANSAFCRFYGKTSGDIVGKSYLSLLPESQYPLFTAAIEELLTEPHRVIYDIQPYSRGGTSRWMEQTMRALTGEREQVEKFQIVLRDITDRKKAEQALKDSEEQFRMIFDSIQDGFAIFEVNYDEKDLVIDARFLEINPAFEKMTGTRTSDVLGKTLWEVFPTMRLLTADLWKDSISGGKNIRIEEMYSRSLDKYFRINGLSPKRGRYAILISDLTDHKKMTEKLVRADRLSSLGEMAAGLAHEINNPLTGVIGLSQLIVEKPGLSDTIKEDIASINKEANRAAGILRDFLIFARGQKPDMRAGNINDVIESVLKLRMTYMRKSGIEVYTDLSKDLPLLMMDVSQIQQVLLNIILNAEYFMIESHKKGVLKISTSRHDNVVRSVFQDDGPGIPAGILPSIFDPFFTTKEPGKGTGLGLSISYGIISEHSGNIFAESKPGHGASFIIELPVASK